MALKFDLENDDCAPKAMGKDARAPRGTRDLYGADQDKFQYIQDTFYNITRAAGYGPIDTPVFEYTPTFHRIGHTTDIINKETYTFEDRGGESLTLRPEGTASVVRALLSNKLTQSMPQKFSYLGQMFRYERPQKGRYRQFYQAAIETFGIESHHGDVTCISIAEQFLKALGLRDRVILEINSLGDFASRDRYRQALIDYFSRYEADLSPDSKRRLKENPLRILDSKDEGDKKLIVGSPVLHDYFDKEANAFFENLQNSLMALKIKYVINPRLVRGIDYYCHTAFEYITQDLGSHAAVLSGGRYDRLVEDMGGPSIPAVGWAAGVDRLALMLDERPCIPPKLALIPMGEQASNFCHAIERELLERRISHDIYWKGQVRKRMQKAEKMSTAYTCVVGDDDLAANQLKIRDMVNQEDHYSTLEFSSIAKILGIAL